MRVQSRPVVTADPGDGNPLLPLVLNSPYRAFRRRIEVGEVGDIGAAVRVIQAWLELSTISRMAEKADATEELARH